MALAAAQWTNQSTDETTKSSNEKSSTNQFNTTASSTKHNEQQSSLPHLSTNVQIVIPFNAPVLNNDYGNVTINNQIYRKYPLPDASTYV